MLYLCSSFLSSANLDPSHKWIVDDCASLLTLENDLSAVRDCSDAVPCSHWVNMGPETNAPAQTCTEYCKQVSSNAATCVSSWLASDQGSDPDQYCKPVEPKSCNESYTEPTPVVCTCAKVGKCTLFAKCDKHSKVYNEMELYDEPVVNPGIGFSIDPRTYHWAIGPMRIVVRTPSDACGPLNLCTVSAHASPRIFTAIQPPV